VKVIAEWQGHKDGGKLILHTFSHVNRAHSQRMAQLMSDVEPDKCDCAASRRSLKEANCRIQIRRLGVPVEKY
jgi:hypothetical protein